MVRGHEHITRIRAGGHKPGQGLAFQIAGQKQPPAGGVHGHHDASFVVGLGSRRRLAQFVMVPGV